MRTQAEVLAVGEAEVAIGMAADVEAVGLVEHRRVAVARSRPEHHPVTLGDLLATEVGLDRRRPGLGDDGAGPPHELLHRGRQ